MVSMMGGKGTTGVHGLLLVVQELALRFEPVVKVTAVLPPTFLITLVRPLRDRTIGRRPIPRRWAVRVMDIVPNALDR